MTPIDRQGAVWAALAWVAPLALALSACASSAPTHYFTLEAVAPATGSSAGSMDTPLAYDGPPLEVRSVQVPPTMDRLEMVRDVAPGELDLREFDHWAAPLARMSRQTLTEDLASRLPRDRLIFPGAAGPQLRADLTVDVLSFRVADGTATMVMSWALRWPLQPVPRGASLQLSTPAAGGAAATARAWSELMAQAADRISADLHAR